MQTTTVPTLSKSVLVLNQSYEPIHVCSVRRAIILVFRGRAEVIESLDMCIRSVSEQFPVPSVVRLGIYVRIAPKQLALSKKNILKRDGHQCQYCGMRRGPMTVDHLVPKTRGGRDTWENLVCACVACNNKKGDYKPEQIGLQLQRKPKRPNNISFIRNFIGISDQRWNPYLFID